MGALDDLKKFKFKEPSFFKSKEAVAVDIGSTSIKIVEMKGSPGKWNLVRCKYIPIGGPGAESPGPERRNQIISALKDFVNKEKKNATKTAVFSISGNSVIVRYVRFQKMSRDDLSKIIQFEAEPYIPFAIPEVIIDFHILGDVMEEGQRKMETILVAAKKEIIQSRREIIEQSGLQPVLIDVDAFALENAYDVNRNPAVKETVLIVHMGASVTTMAIIESGVPKVVRDVFIAGNTLTKALQRNFQCDAKQAESMKSHAFLLATPEERERAMSDQNKEVLQMSTVMLPVMKDLLAEVQRSIDFYLSQGQDRQISRILLSGGASRLGNLVNYFGHELRLPVEIFDPLARVGGAQAVSAEMRPLFAVAVGLALRREGDAG